MGSTNASVLPVPVAADPTTSLPCRGGGMACAWRGVGASKPSRSRATRHFFDKPSPANVISTRLLALTAEHQRHVGGAEPEGVRERQPQWRRGGTQDGRIVVDLR